MTCPKHNVPLRQSKQEPGSFYCPEKVDGKWCRAWADKPVGAAPRVAPAAPQPSDDALAAASLLFAASLCRGAGPEMADEAIAIAIKACSAMKAVK
jgi:hypothetical protein